MTHGKAIGKGEHSPMWYEISQDVRDAYITATNSRLTCHCGEPSVAWGATTDDFYYLVMCADCLQDEIVQAGGKDKPPPCDASPRFGNRYRGSRVPWVAPPYRRIPKTVYQAWHYLFDMGPSCCNFSTAQYWNPDEKHLGDEDCSGFCCDDCLWDAKAAVW